MNRLTLLLDTIFTRRRWVLHVFFWLVVLAFYAIFFGRRNSNYFQTAFFVGLLMPVTIATTYFLNYYLLPHYLMKGKLFKFLLYSFYVLLISLLFEMVVAMVTFIVMAKTSIHNMSPASFDLVFLFTTLVLVVLLGVAIKMVLHWRQSKEEYQQLMHDKVEAELKFLKTQLNPHFLFNTLNNLYYLSSEKSERTPEAILALSEILDYVMHSGKHLFVPLSQEWKQVQNYINLEMLRYEDRVKVTTAMNGNMVNHLIAPMILITLLENSFKHGVMTSSHSSWINLKVDLADRDLIVSIRNSCQPRSGNGIGLANLRNQLNHLYPESHYLKIDNSDPSEFSITLILQKKNEIQVPHR